jgi:hypothetical protein
MLRTTARGRKFQIGIWPFPAHPKPDCNALAKIPSLNTIPPIKLYAYKIARRFQMPF